MATVDTQQQLAWEKRQRPRAGVAALVAAVLTLGADLWTTALLRGAPKGEFLTALQHAVAPGPIADTTSLRLEYFRFYDDRASSFLLSNAVKGLGYIALAWALTFLIVATRARRPISRPVVYVPLIGAVLSAIATVLFAASYNAAVSDFLSGPTTVQRALDAGGGSVILTAQVIGLVGQFALAAGYMFVSLNSMRAGLLTRFMGILGCIIAVLVIIPLGPLPVVQAFWLLGVAALLLGFWPSGTPSAWRTGIAEPWPSQSEVAKQRRAAADARRGARGGKQRPEPASEPQAGPVSARSKRKRKKR